MAKHPDEVRMPLGDHLEELRKRILITLIIPVLMLIPTLVFGEAILNWLLAPLREARLAQGLSPAVQVLSPGEPFISYVKIALLTALLAGTPVALWQAWRFIAPGLYTHERRFGVFLIPSSVFLLTVGVSFNYYVVLPLTLRMFIAFGQTLHPTDLTPPEGYQTPVEVVEGFGQVSMSPFDLPELQPGQFYYNTRLHQWRLRLSDGNIAAIETHPDSGFVQGFEIKAYLKLAIGMIIAFAIAFQLPLVILLLGWVGLVDIAQLKRVRKFAVLSCAVAAAILTPPDITSQVALLIPLYALYELSIILLYLFPASWMMRREGPEVGDA